MADQSSIDINIMFPIEPYPRPKTFFEQFFEMNEPRPDYINTVEHLVNHLLDKNMANTAILKDIKQASRGNATITELLLREQQRLDAEFPPVIPTEKEFMILDCLEIRNFPRQSGATLKQYFEYLITNNLGNEQHLRECLDVSGCRCDKLGHLISVACNRITGAFVASPLVSSLMGDIRGGLVDTKTMIEKLFKPVQHNDLQCSEQSTPDLFNTTIHHQGDSNAYISIDFKEAAFTALRLLTRLMNDDSAFDTSFVKNNFIDTEWRNIVQQHTELTCLSESRLFRHLCCYRGKIEHEFLKDKDKNWVNHFLRINNIDSKIVDLIESRVPKKKIRPKFLRANHITTHAEETLLPILETFLTSNDTSILIHGKQYGGSAFRAVMSEFANQHRLWMQSTGIDAENVRSKHHPSYNKGSQVRNTILIKKPPNALIEKPNNDNKHNIFTADAIVFKNMLYKGNALPKDVTKMLKDKLMCVQGTITTLIDAVMSGIVQRITPILQKDGRILQNGQIDVQYYFDELRIHCGTTDVTVVDQLIQDVIVPCISTDIFADDFTDFMKSRLHLTSFLEVQLPSTGQLRLLRCWEDDRFVGCKYQVKGTRQVVDQKTVDSVMIDIPEAQNWTQQLVAPQLVAPQLVVPQSNMHKFIQQVSPQEATQLAHKYSITEMLATMAWTIDDVMEYVFASDGMLRVKVIHETCKVFKYTDKKNKHETWSALEARLRGAIYVHNRWLEPTPKCFHADQLNLDQCNKSAVQISVKEDGTSILVFRKKSGLVMEHIMELIMTTLGGEENAQVNLIKTNKSLMDCLTEFMNQFDEYCLVQFELLHELDCKHQYVPYPCLRAFHASGPNGVMDLTNATVSDSSLVSVIKTVERPLVFAMMMSEILPPAWDPCSWMLLREGYMAKVTTNGDDFVVKIKSKLWMLCCKGPQVTPRIVTQHIKNNVPHAKQTYLESFGKHLERNGHVNKSKLYVAAVNIQHQRYDRLADQIWTEASRTADNVRTCVLRILPNKAFDETVDVKKWAGERCFLQFDDTQFIDLRCLIALAKKYPTLDWPAKEFVGKTLKLKQSPHPCSIYLIP